MLKRTKWIEKLLLLAIVAASFGFLAQKTQADQVSFYVTPQLPDNQIAKNAGFFYLQMNPGQSQKEVVKLTNNTNKDTVVDIFSASAKTANSGMVSYMPLYNVKNDKSLEYDLTDYIKVQGKVTLKANTSVEVPVQISMPNQAMEGVIAGGLTFKEEGQQTKPAKGASGVSVINNYQFVMAVVLRQNMDIIPPIMSLTSVNASQVNLRNSINIGLENSEKAFVNNMALHFDIKGVDKNNKDVHFRQDEQNLQMAPNSNMEWPYRLNGKAFVPGKYHTTVQVWADQNENGSYEDTVSGKTTHYSHYWEFEKDFTITAEKAKALNKADVSIPKKQINWSLWIIIALVILVLVLFWFLLAGKRRRKDEEEVEENQEK
jgi:hypothetical protein